MKVKIITISLLLFLPVLTAVSQRIEKGEPEAENWDRTKAIMDCVPRLVDRQDLVEDNFDHLYITNNPRDIEVGYFSVEPITYFEEGNRFCEASLPAAGVSRSYFRGTYRTDYTLPGDAVYELEFESNALIFNNEIRIINAQNTLVKVEASHRLQILTDTLLNPNASIEYNSSTIELYAWELEIDESGKWQGNSCEGECNIQDEEIPGGHSDIILKREIRGPGVVTVEESVIFHIEALSAYKYEPIFQAVSLFNLEPLSISAKLLPCAK